jgi:hypothetical protein
MNYLFWLLLLGLSTSTSLAQTIFRIDSLPPQGVLLDKGWRWHAGDNPEWAKSDFEDAKWQAINPALDIHDLPQVRQAQMGWFRLKLQVDSTILQQALALAIRQVGASEIYLDGRVIYRLGVVSNVPEQEQTANLKGEVYSFQLNGQHTHQLAIRYSFTTANFYHNIDGWSNPCLALQLQSSNQAHIDQLYGTLIPFILDFVMSSLYLLLGVTFLFFYFSFNTRKPYLFFGLYAIGQLIAYIFFLLRLRPTSTSFDALCYLVGFVLINIFILFQLAGTYELYNRPKGVAFYGLVCYAVLTVPGMLLFYNDAWMVNTGLYLLSTLDLLRQYWYGMKTRQAGARTLFVTLLIFSVFFLPSLALRLAGQGNLAYIFVSIGMFVGPIGYSLFLAGEFARTAHTLRKRVVEVEELSTEKQQILLTQNEILERQVEARTAELSHKNQELVVEAALERVRSRSLAMHSSEELKQVITLVFNQLNQLDIAITDGSAVIALLSEGSRDLIHWTANPDRISEATSFRLPYIDHPANNRYWEARENRLGFVAESLTFDEKNSYWEQILRVSDYQYLPEATKQWIFASPGYAYSIAIEKHSSLFIDSFQGKMYTEQENDILRRFARVFEQAYVRFLDLQKAETQVREAQIETALERVRSRSLAMQHSNELQEVITLVFQQLNQVQITIDGAAILGVYTENAREVVHWTVNPSQTVKATCFKVPYFDHPFTNAIYEAAEKGMDFVTQSLSFDEKNNYFKVLFTHTDYRYLPDEVKQLIYGAESYTLYVAFEKYTCLMLDSYVGKIYSEHDISILKRFARVFDQAYTRFMDIQKAEAQAREAVRTASLDRVRAQIASMRTTQDLTRIPPLIWQELTTLGVPFIRCGVFIIDQQQEQIHTFLSRPDGNAIATFKTPFATPGLLADALPHWRNKQIYTTHWDEADLLVQAQVLIRQGVIASPEAYLTDHQPTSLYLHLLPFMQGMLYVGNDASPLTEDQINVLQLLADAFSTAYARYDDFTQLESAKQLADSTLSELRAAQTNSFRRRKWRVWVNLPLASPTKFRTL